MRTRHVALAAALLLTACGGPLLSAELEIPEVGITLPSQVFPSVATAFPVNNCGTGTVAGTSCVQTDLVYDLGSKVGLLDQPNTRSEVRLTNLAVTLAATSALSDLGGVRSTVAEVVAPGATEGVVVASYTRAPGAPSPTIAVSGNADLDLVPYIQNGKVTIHVKMTYDAPTPAFRADVTAVFYVKETLDYGKTIGL
jgi:hypothetical protein